MPNDQPEPLAAVLAEMRDEPSPRPWRFEDDQYNPAIVDANGVLVAFPTSPDNRKVATDNARIIVDAVNFYDATVDTQLSALLAERDRLRDQLAAALRLADECSRDAAAVHAERARAVEEAQSEANRRADRLADIVRRLVSSLSVHHSATMAAVMSNREEFDTSDFRKDIDADAALLREARAAIGEDKK